jgi:ssDNA-specific exonuclease RecJ
MLTNNKNGAFCDLTKLDDDVLLSIQNFVNFLRTTTSGWHSTIGNCITSVMMQRHRSSDIPRSLPVFVKDVPVKNACMASQLVKQTPKMAFMKLCGHPDRDTHSNPIKEPFRRYHAT